MAGSAMRLSKSSNAGGFFAIFYEWTVMTAGSSFKGSNHTRHTRNIASSSPRHAGRYQSLQQTASTRPATTIRSPMITNSMALNAACPVRTIHTTTALASNDAPATTSSAKAPEEPPLSAHLRAIMRPIPHSVVVATSTLPAPDRGTPPAQKGMTVSSFTTLTLTPSPIITFNIRKPSSTLSAIIASKHFFIHILSATTSGARIADVFAKNAKGVFKSGEFVVVKGKGRESDGGELEPPLLAAKGITKVLRCKLLEENGVVSVGDHMLILAEVRGVIESGRDGEGLCYSDGKYRGVGDIIEVGEKK